MIQSKEATRVRFPINILNSNQQILSVLSGVFSVSMIGRDSFRNISLKHSMTCIMRILSYKCVCRFARQMSLFPSFLNGLNEDKNVRYEALLIIYAGMVKGINGLFSVCRISKNIRNIEEKHNKISAFCEIIINSFVMFEIHGGLGLLTTDSH
jgi:hypothetical protein